MGTTRYWVGPSCKSIAVRNALVEIGATLLQGTLAPDQIHRLRHPRAFQEMFKAMSSGLLLHMGNIRESACHLTGEKDWVFVFSKPIDDFFAEERPSHNKEQYLARFGFVPEDSVAVVRASRTEIENQIVQSAGYKHLD